MALHTNCDMKRGQNKRNFVLVRKEHLKKRKKIEFSKYIVLWAVAFTIICVFISYALAMCGLDTCSEITSNVIIACIGIVSGYMAKSFAEKNSRNKYGIDEFGNKVCDNEESDEAAG